ncbi:MAG: nucleotidyltransferase domain-containing protein [Elusimicrobiota bacterium]
MLLNKPLDYILGQSSKIKILRFLILSQAQLNGREIAKSVGLSHVKVHYALKDLYRQGLVNLRSVGKSLIYWLNEEHFLVKNILRPIFEKESGILNFLVQSITKESGYPRPLSIILFGSFAKNTASPDSDIDVAIIYPNSKNKLLIDKELFKVEKKITILFGNRLAPIVLKIRDLQNKFKKNEKFIKEIVSTGKIIYGKSFSELINLNVKRYQNN